MRRIPPAAGDQYSKSNEQSFRNAVLEEDRLNVKKGEAREVTRDIYTDTVTGARYVLTVASGVVTLVAL